MDTPYKPIFNMFDSINGLVSSYKSKDISKEDMIGLLVNLSHLERFMDYTRAMVPHGSTIDFKDDNELVNKKLNDFRSLIWEVRDLLSDEEVSNVLDSAGESFKLRFRRK